MSKIPFASLPGGMTIEQCDTIMSLVAIAENGTTNWAQHYQYIEDIRDKRGYTCSLVGFCSATSDLLWVFRDLKKHAPNHALTKYIPALEKVNGTDSTVGLENLPADLKAHGDEAWRKSVWNGILHHYWQPAMKFAETQGLKFAISKGFLYDLALNHGANCMSKFAKRVKVASPAKGGDERAWLRELIAVRQHNIVNEDRSTNSGQPDRCIMWRSILDKDNVDLKRPLTGLVCYKTKFSVK